MNLSQYYPFKIASFSGEKIHVLFPYMKMYEDMIIWRLLRGKVKIEIIYQFVILSFAKDL